MNHLRIKSYCFLMMSLFPLKMANGDNENCSNVNQTELDGIWTVVVTFSIGYDSMFQNWLYWFQKLQLDMKLIVIAEDDNVFKKYKNETSFSVMSFSLPNIETNHTSFLFDSQEFNQITARRPYYLMELLKVYPNIIYSDIDTVWLQDPRPYFMGNFNIWAQLDGVMTAAPIAKGYLPYFCTGFMAMRNSNSTIAILQEWISELQHLKENDQWVFNRMVFENNFNVRSLPILKFPYGEFYFDKMPSSARNDVVVIHNNWILGRMEKIQRFIKHNLWFENIEDSKGSTYRTSQDSWNLKVKDIANHDGIKVLGNEYFSTTCIKGHCITPQEKDFKFDLLKYFLNASSHWKNC